MYLPWLYDGGAFIATVRNRPGESIDPDPHRPIGDLRQMTTDAELQYTMPVIMIV